VDLALCSAELGLGLHAVQAHIMEGAK
jgi:hypothetical protein